jgi:hypothetical protein
VAAGNFGIGKSGKLGCITHGLLLGGWLKLQRSAKGWRRIGDQLVRRELLRHTPATKIRTPN